MGQIFISHSSKDNEAVQFFSTIFAGTKVKAVFEEFEKMGGYPVGSEKIKQDINYSNAVFILMSDGYENVKHTRDWIVWECGYSVQNNRDVWVFEKQNSIGSVSVITPSLTHYVVYNANQNWFGYIRSIVESYDDSNVLGTILMGAAAGATLSEKDSGTGALLGGALGLILSNKNKQKPRGQQIRCISCSSIYNLHIELGRHFRCPVCNHGMKL